MSGDEFIALGASFLLALLGWRAWIGGLLSVQNLSRNTLNHALGWLAPLAAGGALYFVLSWWSSHDVRDAPIYIFFYMAMGFGWAGLWNWLLPFTGLSFRDDALENENGAAGLAISGGLVGATFAFAGANIGEGPGWWVVVFCALLSSGVMLLLWMIGAQITRAQEFITVDRDMAAGWRAAGLFIGWGLILGRAVAGDWHSAQQTVLDFLAKGWPALILWGIALALDFTSKPTPQRPAPNPIVFGLIPFLFFVGLGIGEVIMQGAW
jgi:hypothetical protein